MPYSNGRIGTRAFGFEAEFYGMDQWSAVVELRRRGYQADDDGYHHRAVPYWRITEDGSVSGEGCELVSPVLNGRLKTDMDNARGVLNVLAHAGGVVNRTCGLHVHHNLGGKTVEDIAETVAHWALFQGIINRILPASRWDGEYCAGMYDPDNWYQSIVHSSRGGNTARHIYGRSFGRYHAINLNAIDDHGTLEYRQHSGTLNGDKLEHWVRFTRAMHDVSRIGSYQMLLNIYGDVPTVRDEMSVLDMMRYLRLPRDTQTFYVNRAEALRRNGDDENADEYPEPEHMYHDDDYDEQGQIWCSNCGEYHFDDVM